MVAAFPWKEIVGISLPLLIDQAGKLFKKADTAAQPLPPAQAGATASEQIAVLRQQVEQLEALEAEQARLLKQSLEELQKVSVLAAGLQARANTAVVLATLAVAVAIAAWVLR